MRQIETPKDKARISFLGLNEKGKQTTRSLTVRESGDNLQEIERAIVLEFMNFPALFKEGEKPHKYTIKYQGVQEKILRTVSIKTIDDFLVSIKNELFNRDPMR